jgi:hypothetical protein
MKHYLEMQPQRRYHFINIYEVLHGGQQKKPLMTVSGHHKPVINFAERLCCD